MKSEQGVPLRTGVQENDESGQLGFGVSSSAQVSPVIVISLSPC